ncbi:MAG: hypothetical protein CMP20_15525 [Rickettsiales bacterium]|nr:hypothetical protein [Rickettsiales bacterium]
MRLLCLWFALMALTVTAQPTANIYPTNHNITTLVVAGVHARERITTHVASMLALRAQMRTGVQTGKLIVVTELVKGSDSCWRGNANKVDINRNFPVNWQPSSPDSRMLDYGGPEPLSEPESQFLYDLLETHQPDLFIDLHSGEVAIYTPWHGKFDHAQTAPSAQDLVSRIPELEGVRAGVGSIQGGYIAYGTIADTALGRFNTPCVFTFEVYGNPNADCKGMFNPPHSEWHEHSERWASIVEQTMTECEKALTNLH